VRGLLSSIALALAALAECAAAPHPFSVAVNARAIQPGELVVLAIATAAPVDDLRVHAFGRAQPHYRTGPRAWRALVGVDLDAVPGRHSVTIDGTSEGRHVSQAETLMVRPHRFPTRALHVDEAFVNPPDDVVARIEREAHELAALWETTTPERLWHGPFVRPVPQDANSRFGTRSIFNGQPRAPHGGADFRSPAGTPVHAPAAGRVVLARDLYFTGRTIVIDHGQGLYSTFAHLATMDVGVDAAVDAGEIIGRVGATGRVTGPHLHWAVRVAGARVDPLSLLKLLHSRADTTSINDH
jgi:hypothetical protein